MLIPAANSFPAATTGVSEEVRRTSRGPRTGSEDVLELAEVNTLVVVGGRRLAGEELGELGVKVDEGPGDDLTFGRVGVKKVRLG